MTKGIRTVEVELLRKGPPHNQLLSPLAEYLGICADSGAGSVSIPYEQASFNAVLGELRYEDHDEQDQAPRQRALRTLGRDLGEVLGQIPGFAGALSSASSDVLLNLRLVTSASELSLLPFELAKVPSGSGKSTDNWLALQTSTLVCITRRVRSVVSRGPLPKPPTPKVLFIVGLEIEETLRAKHREILTDAFSPWVGEDVGECLVELGPDSPRGPATAHNIGKELAGGCSYVHILAHGAETGATEAPTYGLLLPGQDTDNDEVDILTGDRFASLLRALPSDVEAPSSILAATCDSANQGDILVPGGSFAHAVHLAGIPLVVASQFPLTMDGSATLAEAFYSELPWGQHPLDTLARARALLHSEYAFTHDWASLVVYDALPENLPEQLEDLRYERAGRALSLAQKRIAKAHGGAVDGEADEKVARAFRDAAVAIRHLPRSEEYAREVEGLKASHEKQLSEAAYHGGDYGGARQHLTEARRLYNQAARRFFLPQAAAQRHATLHWVQIQTISLDRVLGDTSEKGAWETAFRSAGVEMEESDTKYWGHGTLAELWLLRLFEEGHSDEERSDFKAEAERHVEAIVKMLHSDHFGRTSTRRQFSRYAQLWGDPDFANKLALRRLEQWDGELGVRKVAEQLVALLDG